jgi:hypothetical protein
MKTSSVTTADFTPIGYNASSSSLSTVWNSGRAINAMCWNGAALLVGGDDNQLDKASGIYAGASALPIVCTTGVSNTARRIYSVTLSAADDARGQTINYYVSCTGADNWQAITKGVPATITNTGNVLYWKAEMTGVWRTPKLTGVTLTYTDVGQETLPAGLGGDIYYLTDKKTKINIPAGLLTRNTEFTFTNVPAPTSTRAPTTAVVAYDITAKDDDTGGGITEFSKPITLTLYRGLTGGNVTGTSVATANAATSLAIGYWNGLHWVPLSTKVSVDSTGVFLSAKINHLSTYGIVVASPEIKAVVEPNPFTPTSANPVFGRAKFTFPNTEQGTAVLRIWDRNGSSIRELTMEGVSQIEWDGRDMQGNIVEGGVYIYEATAGGASRARGTIVVGR